MANRDEIIETKWRCPICAHVNRGPDMKCANCGDQKPEGVKYFVDEGDAPVVTDREQIADAEAGAHWACTYCGKDNRQRRGTCQYCGCARDQGERKAPKTPARKRTAAPATKPSSPPPALSRPRGLRNEVILRTLGVVAAAAALISLLAFALTPKEITGRVIAKSWERVVRVERNVIVTDTGWEQSLPSGAFDRTCNLRQSGTREVFDHYKPVSRTRQVKDGYSTRQVTKHRSERYVCGETCTTQNLDNGYARRSCRDKYCTRSVPYTDTEQVPKYRTEHYTEQVAVYRTEPVYRQWCSYKEWRWKFNRDIRRSGTTSNPQWPTVADVALGVGGLPERQSRTEALKVSFADQGDPEDLFTYEPRDEVEFLTYHLGDKMRLKIAAFGRVQILERLP